MPEPPTSTPMRLCVVDIGSKLLRARTVTAVPRVASTACPTVRRVSRTTPCSATAERPRSCRARARSTGGASRASTAPACFAALLGTPEHGRFLIAPTGPRAVEPPVPARARWCSRPSTTPTPVASASSTASRSGTRRPLLVRLVEGHRAAQVDDARSSSSCASTTARSSRGCAASTARGSAVAGPDGLELRTPVRPARREPDDRRPSSPSPPASGSRSCSAGSRRTTRGPCPTTPTQLVDAHDRSTGSSWSARCDYSGEWREPVLRSLLTLEALTYRADRRHRRRAHHVAAGDARRHAQLGLPLLLGARRDAHARGALIAGGYQRRGRCAGASGCCARPPATRRAADDVRRRRRAPAHRARARLAPRLRAARARCAPATPRTRSSSSTCTASCSTCCGRACAPTCCSSDETRGRWSRLLLDVARGRAGASPTRASGRCAGRRRHFTHSKVMCWVAFDRADRDRRAGRLRRPGRPLARDPRRDPRRGVRRRRSTRSSARSRRRYDVRRARRGGADDPARRLPARRRSARRVDDRGDPPRRERGGLTRDGFVHALRARPHERSTASASREGVFLPCSFWMVEALALAGQHRRRARAVRAPARDRQRRRAATPRSTTRTRRVCSATSRRRSRTSRSSRAAHTLAPERSPMRQPAPRPAARRGRPRDRGAKCR